MKDGIVPNWEDSNNINGGCWSFKITKKQAQVVWTNLSMALIGNTICKEYKNLKEINGISITIKSNFCIFKLWNCNSKKNNLNIIDSSLTCINLNESR